MNIVKGSILDMADGADTAVALMNAKIAIVCDVSYSMSEFVQAQRKAKSQIQQEVLTDLQGRYPGQVAVVAFSDEAMLCLDGVLPAPDGGTNVAAAFAIVEQLQAMGIKAVFTSDGEPSHDPMDYLIEYAKRNLVGAMDVIYVGDAGEDGEKFMRELARAVSGQFGSYLYDQSPALLTEKLEQLLLSAG